MAAKKSSGARKKSSAGARKKAGSTGKKQTAKRTVKKAAKAAKALPRKAHKAAENMMTAGQVLQNAAVVVESVATQIEKSKPRKKR